MSKEIASIKSILASKLEAFTQALGSQAQAEKFLLMAMNTITMDENLRNCSPDSQLTALMDVAAHKLFPSKSLGHVWLIGYNGVCTFQLGYKGMVVLAYRSGQIKNIGAQVVYDADKFDYSEGTNGYIKHQKCLTVDRYDSPKVAVYSAADLMNGGTSVKVLPYCDVLKVRNESNAWKSGRPKAMAFWKQHEDAMAAKTALRNHAKFLYIGDDFAQALAMDDERVDQFERHIVEVVEPEMSEEV